MNGTMRITFAVVNVNGKTQKPFVSVLGAYSDKGVSKNVKFSLNEGDPGYEELARLAKAYENAKGDKSKMPRGLALRSETGFTVAEDRDTFLDPKTGDERWEPYGIYAESVELVEAPPTVVKISSGASALLDKFTA